MSLEITKRARTLRTRVVNPSDTSTTHHSAKGRSVRTDPQNSLHPEKRLDFQSLCEQLIECCRQYEVLLEKNKVLSRQIEELVEDKRRLETENGQLWGRIENLTESGDKCNEQLQSQRDELEQQSQTITQREEEIRRKNHEITVGQKLLEARQEDLERAKADMERWKEKKRRELDQQKHDERCWLEGITQHVQARQQVVS